MCPRPLGKESWGVLQPKEPLFHTVIVWKHLWRAWPRVVMDFRARPCCWRKVWCFPTAATLIN